MELFAMLNMEWKEIVKQNKFLSFIAMFYFISVFIGAYRYYSPFPVGDMWDGYLGFYLRIMEGDYSAWWAQHNEHRIMISKLFFYLDLEYFGGLSLILIPLNLVLLLSCWSLLLFYTNNLLKNKIKTLEMYYFIILITVFSFSWKQDENIVWAFQSQFWFAYLLPLVAFLFLSLSETHNEKRWQYYALSCLFGILSVGSMANGILVLPVLVAQSILLRQKMRYSLFLVVLAIFVSWLYLVSYQVPQHNHSAYENIKNLKIEFIVFFIEYLGSPLKSVFGSFVLGLLHLFLIYNVSMKLCKEKFNPIHISIVAFIAYYLCSALIIAAARVDIGVSAALVGRYTTPSIISLFLVLILYFHFTPRNIKYINKRNITIIAILMLGTQARTIIKNVNKIHDIQKYEAMQLALGVYPDIEVQKVANAAVANKLSIFSIKPYVNKRGILGQKIDTSECTRTEFAFISPNQYKSKGQLLKDVDIYVVNTEMKIIGVGIQTESRKNHIAIIKQNNENINNTVSFFTCLHKQLLGKRE